MKKLSLTKEVEPLCPTLMLATIPCVLLHIWPLAVAHILLAAVCRSFVLTNI